MLRVRDIEKKRNLGTEREADYKKRVEIASFDLFRVYYYIPRPGRQDRACPKLTDTVYSAAREKGAAQEQDKEGEKRDTYCNEHFLT